MTKKSRVLLVLVLCLLLTCAACKPKTGTVGSQPVIGIAWRADLDSEFYTNVVKSIEAAGGSSVLLPQVRSADLPYDENGKLTEGVDETGALTAGAGKLIRCGGYPGSNAAEAAANVSAVVFTGGEDISTSLYFAREPWHGIEEERDYNAERDVSDYLLMDYCLDHDIPILGLCRGMQMLGVISGAEVIQDIPTFFAENGKEYHYQHRNQKETPDPYRDYAPHDVSVAADSLLHKVTNADTLTGCPSWHHQALRNVNDTRLRVVGTLDTDGIEMIEAIERPDKTFALGLQFHPEAAVVKHLENAENADSFMSCDDALRFFTVLLDKAK